MLLRLALILALVLGAIGLGTMGFQLLAPPPPAPVEPAIEASAPIRPRFLVAARSLAAGTLLKDDDLQPRALSLAAASPEALVASAEILGELRGAMVRRWIDQGEAVGRADLLWPRDRGFLAAVLRPGMRAISVGVDVVTGAAGLIWPGDQVDLILTQELGQADAPLANRVIGETILVDLRVIAVDQQFTQGATAADATPARIARTVTLEASGAQAERIAVASRLGRIALTIRAIEPPAPDQDSVRSLPVFGADVSSALGRSGLPQGRRMRVIQGDDSQEVTFR